MNTQSHQCQALSLSQNLYGTSLTLAVKDRRYNLYILSFSTNKSAKPDPAGAQNDERRLILIDLKSRPDEIMNDSVREDTQSLPVKLTIGRL